MSSDVGEDSPLSLGCTNWRAPPTSRSGGISRRDTLPSGCGSWRVPGQGHATDLVDIPHSGADERAAARKYDWLQADLDVNSPDWLADEAVVA